MARLALIAALALAPLPAAAVTVSSCSDVANVWAVAEPWEANTKLFANGEIRLVVLDTVEPAAAAFHLVILHPPRDELGIPQCSMVSAAEGYGFGGMDLGPAEAGYDPARGLTVALPIRVYDPDSADFFDRTLSVTVNQATGQVEAVSE
ncbi:MAG: hypothetical protein ACKO1H_00260 [Tabrizicola sp.]